ncbi:hypothetical protein OPV22_017491 [Ensete ventricosum]|uniref:Uncharacterized protein n=1 Tax=Ensete ventricosum TaxID=4639 RepID=A0AAV8PF04_ENSVE|nr:hypothetical protein OPV22_017491 [Ensete ventricosum]
MKVLLKKHLPMSIELAEQKSGKKKVSSGSLESSGKALFDTPTTKGHLAKRFSTPRTLKLNRVTDGETINEVYALPSLKATKHNIQCTTLRDMYAIG